MHRVQRANRAAFLAATLIALFRASVADSRLSLQCKNIARDVIMNSCKGPRITRATPRLDLVQLADKTSKLEPAETSRDTTSDVEQRKRQLFMGSDPSVSGLFGGVGLSETNIASDTYHYQTQLNVPGLGYMQSEHSSMLEENYNAGMPIPYRPMGPYRMPRSSKTDELLGFDLNSDELDELYYEIGDRLARNSKDLNKKIFQHVATKCCPNPTLCYDNPGLIPCMGY